MTIKWADGDGDCTSGFGSYTEYTVEVEPMIRQGCKGDWTTPGESACVEDFRVVDVESAVCYPFAGSYGYELKLVHESPAARKSLIEKLHEAMQDDFGNVLELLNEEWEPEESFA